MRGLGLCRKHSEIQTLAALKGEKMSFVDILELIALILQIIVLILK